MIQVVVDEQIPALAGALLGLAEVRTLPAAAIRPGALGAAEFLCVRTVTRVDAALLRGSHVRVVATASSGTDHIDQAFLEEAGISLLSAAGCNGTTVAEYVLAALLLLCSGTDGRLLRGRRVGIIGCGHTGGALWKLLESLGVECVCNDPPLAARTGDPRLCSLREALAADIISLHVPLTHAGPYPTHQLLGASRLVRLSPGTLLVNTSRAGVLDEAVLAKLLQAGHLRAVLDVWGTLPGDPPCLLEGAALATPHIAGYSLDARLRATEMLYRGICRTLGVAPRYTAIGPPPAGPRLCSPLDPDGDDPEAVVKRVVLSCCDPRPADRTLRALLTASALRRASLFEELRCCSPLRREFGSFRLAAPGGEAFGASAPLLERLGFRMTNGATPGALN